MKEKLFMFIQCPNFQQIIHDTTASKHQQELATRKLCYRKDDRAMRAI